MRGILGLLGDFLLHRKAGPPNTPPPASSNMLRPLTISVGDSLTQFGNLADDPNTKIENQGDSIIGWANALSGGRCKHIVWFDSGATGGAAPPKFRGSNFGIAGDTATQVYDRRTPMKNTGALLALYLAGTNIGATDSDPAVAYGKISDWLDDWINSNASRRAVVGTIPARRTIANPGGTDISPARWLNIMLINADIRTKVAGYTADKLYLADYELATLDVGNKDAVFVCNFDGADAATTSKEETNDVALTFTGNAQLDTAQFKFGTASLLLDGTGDYVDAPDSANWDFTGEFEIDIQLRYTGAAPGVKTLLSHEGAAGQRAWRLDVDFSVNPSKLKFIISGDGTATAHTLDVDIPGGVPAADTWHHVRVARDASDVLRGWFNGNFCNKITAATDPFTSTAPLRIGASDAGAQAWNGWLDAIRVRKGSSSQASDANFTAPTWAPGAYGNPIPFIVRDGVHLLTNGAFVLGDVTDGVLATFIDAGVWWDTDAGSLNLTGNNKLTGSVAVSTNSCTGNIPGSPCTLLNTAGAAQPVTCASSVAANGEGGQTWILDISSADGAGGVGTVQTVRASPGTINVASAGLNSTDWVQMFYELEVTNAVVANGKGLIGDVSATLSNGTITAKGLGFTNANRDTDPWPIIGAARTLHAYTEALPVNAATVITPRIDCNIRRDVGAGSCQVKIKRIIVRKVNNPSTDVPYTP